MKKLVIGLIIISSYSYPSAQNIQRYLLANYYQFSGDLSNAGYWYSQITPDQNADYIYLGYIPYLAANNNFSSIVELIPKYDERFKNNLEIQLLFALALETTGNKSEAERRMVALNEQYKTNQELAFKVIQLYLMRAEPENALKVIDNLLNSAHKPNNYVFYFLKAQAFLQLNKKAEALTTVQYCIQSFPKFDKSWLLYAALQEQHGKIEEAIKGYNNYLQITTDATGEIQKHLLQLTFKNNLTKKLSQKKETGLKEQAFTLFEQNSFTKALHSINSYLEKNNSDTQARLLKIQLLISTRKIDEAAQLLKEWSLESTDAKVWLKTLHLLSYLGLPYKKGLQLLQTIEKQKGSTSEVLLYQSDLALRDNNQTLALHLLQRAYKNTLIGPIKASIALQISLIYLDQKQWVDAKKIIEDALTVDQNYLPLHNVLAYLYSTKLKNTSRAMELIETVLQKDPENPHFLDTKAFIYYKQRDFKQATTLLQKSAQLCPTDFTILSHLGKCYYKQGKKDLALQTLKAAALVASTDAQKIKIKKYSERWYKE